MRRFASLEEFSAASGEHLGYSAWHEVTQSLVSLFAEATGDRQWIHVDPERAASGPFGAAIAHGYLTLALLPVFMTEIFHIDQVSMVVNHGLDRVRFPGAVPVGARIRAGLTLTSVRDTQLGKLAVSRVIVEVEGRKRAACVASAVMLYVPAAAPGSPDPA